MGLGYALLNGNLFTIWALDLLALPRWPARAPAPAACCGCLRGQTPNQRLHRVVVSIGHTGSRKHGPRHHGQWTKRLPHRSSLLATWPAGRARSEAAASWWSPCWGYPGASNGLAAGGRYMSITEDRQGGWVQPAAIHRGQAWRGSSTAALAPARSRLLSRHSGNHE